MNNNYEISRFYFIYNRIDGMSHSVKTLNNIMARKPDEDHTREIDEVKRRLKVLMDDINELLEKEEEPT